MPLSPTDNVQPPSSQPTIFVLEDDADVARLICMSLSDYGFRCEHLSTGRQLLARARQSAPDLCIVDLGLPDMDGMQVVRELQDGSPCAVLILTGRNDVTDRVLGLELGADDYIVKPFEPRELVARVRSILRRYQRAPAPEPASERKLARFASWAFDASRHALTAPDGREMSLSAAESETSRPSGATRAWRLASKVHPAKRAVLRSPAGSALAARW